jgi:hypothetical protein
VAVKKEKIGDSYSMVEYIVAAKKIRALSTYRTLMIPFADDNGKMEIAPPIDSLSNLKFIYEKYAALRQRSPPGWECKKMLKYEMVPKN